MVKTIWETIQWIYLQYYSCYILSTNIIEFVINLLCFVFHRIVKLCTKIISELGLKCLKIHMNWVKVQDLLISTLCIYIFELYLIILHLPL